MKTDIPGINKPYIIIVSVLTFVFPAIAVLIEWFINHTPITMQFIGKWFIFFAVGLRLFFAGIRQSTKPAFTAKEIFHIHDASVYPIVRELGFANLCFGLVGIISIFIPQWRIVSAFASGLYYGIAGLNHFVKKPAGANEMFALVTDVFIFLVLLGYVVGVWI